MENASAPRPCPALPARLCTLLAVLLAVSASATDLASQKLFGKWSLTPTSYGLGAHLNTAALSPKWIVVGDAGARDRGGVAIEGGVQVFNAATGAWVRKPLPPASAANDQRFGAAVAISGDLAVVGAYSTNASQGIAYLYNLTTGALLRTLSAADGVAGDQFGFNVATNGTVAVIGAPRDDTNRGSIYLFNVATGLQIAKIQAFDGAADHYFGWGLAMEGNIIAVGADGVDGSKGAVYFYDASTQTLIKKYQPAAWAANDAYGDALSMHQGRVVIGNYSGLSTGKAWLYDLATGAAGGPLTVGGSGTSFGSTVAINGPLVAVSENTSGQGRVHLFKSSDRSFIRTLLPPNGDINPQRFGLAIALDGTRLLATAPDDSVQAFAAGAAHLIGPLTQDMPYSKVIAKGDFAPGAPNTSIGTIGDAFINSSGETLFTSTLTGTGAAVGENAAFTDLVTLGRQELQHRSSDIFAAGVKYGTISRVSMNDINLAVGYATLTGTGVTAANNTLVWYRTDAFSSLLFRTGTPVAEFANDILASVPEVVTSNSAAQKRVGAICNLKLGGLVNASNDSGIYGSLIPAAGSILREGFAAIAPLNPATQKLGQVAPRLCYHYQRQIYSTALTSTDTSITSANNAAVFRRNPGSGEELIAQKGQEASDTLGFSITSVRYSTFIGESSNGDNAVIFRATLSGPVSTSNNERLWRKASAGSLIEVLSKGDNPTGPGFGIKIVKFISFWGMGSVFAENQVLALVQLAGTGVTAANDQALVLVQTDGSELLLMREGDPAPGCGGAKVGVISRVEADPYSSSYAVLATLTGAPVGTELALFTGNVMRGNAGDQSPLRRPFLRVRKGQFFDNQPSKVKSISLPTGNITASGAGGTGRGRAISWTGNFTFVVEFENGVRQIMKGNAN